MPDDTQLEQQLGRLLEVMKAARVEMLAVQSLHVGFLAREFAVRDLDSREDRKAWFSDLTQAAIAAAPMLSDKPDTIAAAIALMGQSLAAVEGAALKLLEGRKAH